MDEILSKQEWAYDTVCRFALQAAAQVPGIKAIMQRADICRAVRVAEWPGDKKKESDEKGEKEDAMAVDDHDEGHEETKGKKKKKKLGKKRDLAYTYLRCLLIMMTVRHLRVLLQLLPLCRWLPMKPRLRAMPEEHFLMSQLCVRDYTLLGAILDLAGASITATVEDEETATGTLTRDPPSCRCCAMS